ncbi:MAG: hypothetical protein J0H34_19915 [Rhizobiales bacterium]|nr:hypothetical protein [Hyphomicrobiales bacterium]
MFRRFLKDVRGNYAILTGIAIVPMLGAVAVGVDYAEMSRQRQDTLNALDASCIATARRILEGATDNDAKLYARKFFDTNLGATTPDKVALDVQLPTNNVGGGRIQLDATLTYTPHFLPPFRRLISSGPVTDDLTIDASSACQLKNTVEVALVLDNSGSMSDKGKGSGKKRIDLLKSAAAQLVDQLAATGQIMKQVEKPVQFSVVPFAASVNIGAANATESWMDTTGISPIHHENFDWTTMPANMQIKQLATGGPYYKKGTGWGAAENQVVTRFTLFDDMKRSACDKRGNNCTLQPYASWGGCVESRPYPYNTDDTAPSASNPSTLYVPMFGPDEADNSSAENSWWTDTTSSSNAMTKQRYAYKYYASNPRISAAGTGDGPNASCTTTAITPLTDVTTSAGVETVKAAINAMQPNGATNVPEGLAWGWRTLSSQAPFTGGRSETERGNDKVVIVLTDGANTYYTPSSLGYSDSAGNKSTYSAYGYARLNDGSTAGRIFSSTALGSGDDSNVYANDNYTAAMNEQFLATCKNANGGETGSAGAGLIIMTVALDLDSTKSADQKQLSMLQTCASRSRYARDPNDLTKGRKLFWNATGANLSQVFKEIADELSNLRIVS